MGVRWSVVRRCRWSSGSYEYISWDLGRVNCLSEILRLERSIRAGCGETQEFGSHSEGGSDTPFPRLGWRPRGALCFGNGVEWS